MHNSIIHNLIIYNPVIQFFIDEKHNSFVRKLKISSIFTYFLYFSSSFSYPSPINFFPPLTHKNISSRNDGVSVNIPSDASIQTIYFPLPLPLLHIPPLESCSLLSPTSNLSPPPDPGSPLFPHLNSVPSSQFPPMESYPPLALSSPPQLFSVPISIPKPVPVPAFSLIVLPHLILFNLTCSNSYPDSAIALRRRYGLQKYLIFAEYFPKQPSIIP